ncbi:hypothetical protein Glove_134g23 [Diversispora epigaea]|uniref:Uncharacterized protein n=1 Tax=Diversispora epigaea TaxID=1348612 RepID=A0A397IZJ4_9GLOM|nr:hypothetical protein Glove_134g23 [Diversispora epigaea]
MKIPTLTSKKHKILTHNNINYYLFYHPILNCIKNILSISDISQNFTLRFENFKYKGEKAYSEQYTGNWWKNTEASLPDGSKLLSIILYSDVTTTDTLSKSSLHPIYILIGNISTKRHPLFAKKDIDLEVDNETYWFFPRISTIICDWPEAATFSLVYKLTNSNFPCHFCLISKTLLSNTDLSDITFRNNENMQEYFYNDARQNVTLLQKQDNSLVSKIDDRLSKIPRFQKFQMFINGLQSISRMTAKEYRILMKVMVFVVDNLYEENKNNVENFVENRKLSEKDTFEWAKLFVEIFKLHSSSNLKFPKFHSWIYHIFESIRQFGAINGYTTETYKSLHKDFVKIPYRMSNKKKCGRSNNENKNRSIIRAKNKFHDKPWFSNVAISMDSNESSDYQSDKGLCYGKILLMAKIEIKEESPLNLALVQWYDFKFQKNSYLYNCPLLKLVELYNLIPIETIDNIVHIIPRLCYGKILLMAKIEIKEESPLNLALVQWYDFKFQKNSYLYNCPLLKLVELYNLIPIETIDNIVHIIPRFDKDNEYFVNKYIS